jgi:ubiquinone/menaquinone biosynthesis C-methylase UbiE
MDRNSVILKETLSRPELHNTWVSRYYTGRNDVFYNIAFDYIQEKVKPSSGDLFLDAGCGNGAHSVRLAKRGFNVTAVDFSSEALKLCRENIKLNKVEKQVSIREESLLGLNFTDKSFDGVLCWGVLMHIPEVEKALDELCRVVKSGGYLVLCENSNNAVETRLRNIIKKIFRIKNTKDFKTYKGMECWTETEAGKFLVRKTNFNWLIRYVTGKDFSLVDRRAAQFTELYSWISFKPLKTFIQLFNEFWFRFIRAASPSLGQIIIFRKHGN